MNPIQAARIAVFRGWAQSSYEGSDYRRAIALLQEAQGDLESTGSRTREWWSLRAREAHTHRMRGDHEACIAVALGALAGVIEITPQDRMSCEVDLLASCIETRPLALVEKVTQGIFAQSDYDDDAPCTCFKHYTLGLLAQRRGKVEEAYSHFIRSWDIRRRLFFPVYTRMVHLVKCAEMACLLGGGEEVARWLEIMERTPFEIPCDEVRLRFAQVMALRRQPPGAAVLAAIREKAWGALRQAEARPEKIHYWNYILGLIYGLAAAGDLAGARHFTAILPAWPPFERALWDADFAWFAAAAEHGCPVPDLAPTPAAVAPGFRHGLPPEAAHRVQAGFQATGASAAAEDARLQTDWRTRLVASRLEQTGGKL